jgi:hypothetical protein
MSHQPTATVVSPSVNRESVEFDCRFNLTRAEAHALRRCAPLTPQFKAPLLEPGSGSLRHL